MTDALISSWLCSSWPWSIYHPLLEFLARWEEIELHSSSQPPLWKKHNFNGPTSHGWGQGDKPKPATHSGEAGCSPHTQNFILRSFRLNPHLPATNLAQASITSAGTAALASPQSSLSSGSMLTLHNSKKVFSECNPAPSHTLSIYSHGPLLKLCSAPLPLPTPACKIIQILMDTLLPLIKGLCILMPLLPPYLLFSYQLKGYFSKEIVPNLQNRSNTLKWALPQILNHSYKLPLCELLINAYLHPLGTGLLARIGST